MTSHVGFLKPPINQPPPPYFQRKGRQCRGPSYERRQHRRRANHELNSREDQSSSNVTTEDKANPTLSSNVQAEKLVPVPCLTSVDVEVLPREVHSLAPFDEALNPQINEKIIMQENLLQRLHQLQKLILIRVLPPLLP